MSKPDGGYTVPVEIEKTISTRLAVISPISRRDFAALQSGHEPL